MDLSVWDSVGWFALVVGVSTLVVGLSRRSKSRSQLSWKPVLGAIATSEVRYDGELYVPSVTYSYEFAGQHHIGDTVRSGLASYNWRAPAERICKKYAVNAEVHVYVDPREPSHAVLEPGGDRSFLPLMCTLGAFFGLIGLLLLAS
jgi:hypothetical protein